MIKVMEAMRAGLRPPTLHTDQPLDDLAGFRPLTAAEPWASDDVPRRAGISAFGFGGNNAHLVLEQGVVGEVYNIGAHNELTNRDITMRLLELTGRDESAIEWVPDRLGHDRRYSVNIDKVTALGWELHRDFDAGLEHTVEWYRTHREWWEPLKLRVGL